MSRKYWPVGKLLNLCSPHLVVVVAAVIVVMVTSIVVIIVRQRKLTGNL